MRQLHLCIGDIGAPRYMVNPGNADTGVFAVLYIGPLAVHLDSPAELRRLADVCANAADVLEQAQMARVKASKCCHAASHDLMRAHDETWASLAFVGYQDDGDGGRLELRNCPCGGTISRPVTKAVNTGGLAVAR